MVNDTRTFVKKVKWCNNVLRRYLHIFYYFLKVFDAMQCFVRKEDMQISSHNPIFFVLSMQNNATEATYHDTKCAFEWISFGNTK